MPSTIDTQLVQDVVTEVLRSLSTPGKTAGTSSSSGSRGSGSGDGLFSDVDTAVKAATRAQQQLAEAGYEVRDKICKLYKDLALKNAPAWGKFELDETQVGRVDHKIVKLELLQNVPGVEFLQSPAAAGDNGISLQQPAPWGLIGVITPVTHSIPTLTANAINMVAAGNALVVNAHPSGSKSAALAATTYNRAVREQFGLDPLICLIDPPTLKSAEQIFRHPDIPLLCATGGPAVARAAMQQPKRSIVAGPGNPPVVVDASADVRQAARAIIDGGSFDNNLLCIGEKQVFCVADRFDDLMAAFDAEAAAILGSGQIDRLTDVAFNKKPDGHFAVDKDLVGKDAAVLADAAGASVGSGVDLLVGVTDAHHPFVDEEQMMPFVPIVKVRDFDEALAQAIRTEHGFGHTAIIHSNDLEHITRMGRAMNTTLFVTNGPCTAALGGQGNGYASYSIATPTGEGVTSPLTFTRFRRHSLRGSLSIT
jgi:aldehyde dehydrogenase